MNKELSNKFNTSESVKGQMHVAASYLAIR